MNAGWTDSYEIADGGDSGAAKSQLRSTIHHNRAHLSPDDRAATRRALSSWVRQSPVPLQLTTVGAYISLDDEPDTTDMVDALLDLGASVLLPVVAPGPPAPLMWAPYHGPDSLAPGRFGILEPQGHRLGPAAIAHASALFIPALAVSVHGVRLGRGAGYYDRSLASTSAARIAIIYDDELRTHVPGDHHDISMDWALSPSAGFTRLAVRNSECQ